MSFSLPFARNILRMNFWLGFISSALWLGTIWVHHGRKEALIWIANSWGESLFPGTTTPERLIFVEDMTGHLTTILLIRGIGRFSKPLHKKALKLFEYYPGTTSLLYSDVLGDRTICVQPSTLSTERNEWAHSSLWYSVTPSSRSFIKIKLLLA